MYTFRRCHIIYFAYDNDYDIRFGFVKSTTVGSGVHAANAITTAQYKSN